MNWYTNIFCIGTYLALAYIESFFSTVCCFINYSYWSVNCMSWISTISTISTVQPQFFSDMLRNWSKIYISGLYVLSFIEVNFQLADTFLAFFIWFLNWSTDSFSHFVSQLIVWVQSLNHVTYLGDVQKLKH